MFYKKSCDFCFFPKIREVMKCGSKKWFLKNIDSVAQSVVKLKKYMGFSWKTSCFQSKNVFLLFLHFCASRAKSLEEKLEKLRVLLKKHGFWTQTISWPSGKIRFIFVVFCVFVVNPLTTAQCLNLIPCFLTQTGRNPHSASHRRCSDRQQRSLSLP